MKLSLYCLLLFLPFIASCQQEVSGDLPISEFDQKLLKNAILVDVRTPEEYNNGYIKNAKNINWFDADFAERFRDVDKNQTIYLYCKVGGRSSKAQKKLQEMGYKKVVNLSGGYDAYKGEVIKNPAPK